MLPHEPWHESLARALDAEQNTALEINNFLKALLDARFVPACLDQLVNHAWRHPDREGEKKRVRPTSIPNTQHLEAARQALATKTHEKPLRVYEIGALTGGGISTPLWLKLELFEIAAWTRAATANPMAGRVLFVTPRFWAFSARDRSRFEQAFFAGLRHAQVPRPPDGARLPFIAFVTLVALPQLTLADQEKAFPPDVYDRLQDNKASLSFAIALMTIAAKRGVAPLNRGSLFVTGMVEENGKLKSVHEMRTKAQALLDKFPNAQMICHPENAQEVPSAVSLDVFPAPTLLHAISHLGWPIPRCASILADHTLGGPSIRGPFRKGAANFLDHYVGQNGECAFGGRGAALAKLHAWLRETAAPRAVLRAPAGRGKSAVLVNFALEAAAHTRVIFLPISSRFATNQRSLVLQFLARCLAELLGEALDESQILTVDELDQIIEGQLRRVETPLLLVIDGLDEAPGGWRLQVPEFLSSTVKFLVSMRPVAALIGQWCEFNLDHLTEGGVQEVLHSFMPQFDTAEWVAALFAKSQGDALLLALWLERLKEPRPLSIERLRRGDPGLKGFIAVWWREQEILWEDAGKSAEMVGNGVRTILSLLSMAHGPLRWSEICWMLDWNTSDNNRPALADFARWVLGDFENGLVLQHPAMAVEFGREGPGLDRFLALGSKAVEEAEAQRRADTEPVIDLFSQYGVQFYATHLKESYFQDPRTGAAATALARLVSPAWREACASIDPSGSRFLEDLAIVEFVARKEADSAAEAGRAASTFATELLVIFARAREQDEANSMPPKVLAYLLRKGCWTSAQGRSVANRAGQIHTAEVLPFLDPLDRASAIAEALEFDDGWAYLDKIAEAIAKSGDYTGGEPVWSGARAMGQVDVLAKLLSTVPIEEFDDRWKEANSIGVPPEIRGSIDLELARALSNFERRCPDGRSRPALDSKWADLLARPRAGRPANLVPTELNDVLAILPMVPDRLLRQALRRFLRLEFVRVPGDSAPWRLLRILLGRLDPGPFNDRAALKVRPLDVAEHMLTLAERVQVTHHVWDLVLGLVPRLNDQEIKHVLLVWQSLHPRYGDGDRRRLLRLVLSLRSETIGESTFGLLVDICLQATPIVARFFPRPARALLASGSTRKSVASETEMLMVLAIASLDSSTRRAREMASFALESLESLSDESWESMSSGFRWERWSEIRTVFRCLSNHLGDGGLESAISLASRSRSSELALDLILLLVESLEPGKALQYLRQYRESPIHARRGYASLIAALPSFSLPPWRCLDALNASLDDEILENLVSCVTERPNDWIGYSLLRGRVMRLKDPLIRAMLLARLHAHYPGKTVGEVYEAALACPQMSGIEVILRELHGQDLEGVDAIEIEQLDAGDGGVPALIRVLRLLKWKRPGSPLANKLLSVANDRAWIALGLWPGEGLNHDLIEFAKSPPPKLRVSAPRFFSAGAETDFFRTHFGKPHEWFCLLSPPALWQWVLERLVDRAGLRTTPEEWMLVVEVARKSTLGPVAFIRQLPIALRGNVDLRRLIELVTPDERLPLFLELHNLGARRLPIDLLDPDAARLFAPVVIEEFERWLIAKGGPWTDSEAQAPWALLDLLPAIDMEWRARVAHAVYDHFDLEILAANEQLRLAANLKNEARAATIAAAIRAGADAPQPFSPEELPFLVEIVCDDWNSNLGTRQARCSPFAPSLAVMAPSASLALARRLANGSRDTGHYFAVLRDLTPVAHELVGDAALTDLVSNFLEFLT